MFRYWVGAVLGALLAVAFSAMLWRPTAPTAPPNSVIVNFAPYPEPKAVSGAPKASHPVSHPVVTPPLPPLPSRNPLASKGTWKRVTIVHGRRCYEPKGGGPITERYCE